MKILNVNKLKFFKGMPKQIIPLFLCIIFSFIIMINTILIKKSLILIIFSIIGFTIFFCMYCLYLYSIYKIKKNK